MEPSSLLLSNKAKAVEKVRPVTCLCLSWQHTTIDRKIAAGFGDGKINLIDYYKSYSRKLFWEALAVVVDVTEVKGTWTK